MQAVMQADPEHIPVSTSDASRMGRQVMEAEKDSIDPEHILVSIRVKQAK